MALRNRDGPHRIRVSFLTSKGKYYSPYDAALIKGHTEAKDLLYIHNGRPGSAVADYAAQTIQIKYRYHKTRKTRTPRGDSAKHKSPGGKKRKSSSNLKQKSAQEKEALKIPEETVEETAEAETNEETAQTENKEEIFIVKNQDTGEKESQSSEAEKVKEPDKHPKYVDKATQVTAVAGASAKKRSLKAAAPDITTAKKDPESESSEKTQERESTEAKPDTSSTDGKSSPVKQSSVETPRDSKSPSKQSTPDKNQNQTSSQSSEHTASPKSSVQVPTAAAVKANKTKSVKDEKTKTVKDESKERRARDSSQSDDDSRSDHSTSHGNTSDIESSSSEVNHRKKVKKSPITRGARYSTKQQQQQQQKQKSINSEKKLTRQPAVGGLRKDSNVKPKTLKSSSEDAAQNDKHITAQNDKTTSKQNDETVFATVKQDHSKSIQSKKTNEKLTSAPAETNESKSSDNQAQNSKQTSGVGKTQSKAADSRSSKSPDKKPVSKTNAMGTTSVKPLTVAPHQNGHATVDGTETAKSRKVKDSENKKGTSNLGKKNVKYSSSSDALHLDSDRDHQDHKSDEGVDMKKKSQVQQEDDQGYTDIEEMAGNAGHEVITPRRKKTRPNKLIQSVQESVKRYESERRSIRQLHQIRRAQIYSGPIYDVALFRKIVDNVKHKQQNGETTNAENWEEYLQEQMKVIQDERAKSASSKKGLNTQDGQDTNRSGTASYPQPHPSHRREKTTLDGRTPRQTTDLSQPSSQNNSNHSSKNNTARSNNNMRLARSHTVHGTRMSSTQKDDDGHIEDSYYEDPLRYMSREAVKRRHELAQQQLLKAYRPYGGAEVFYQSSTSPTRPTTQWRRPTSTMSSKTNTSVGSAASMRQSRTSNFTIMTAYGSRKIRQPPQSDGQSKTSNAHSQKQYPLMFQDPDSYEKSKQEEARDRSPPRQKGQGRGRGYTWSHMDKKQGQGAGSKLGHR